MKTLHYYVIICLFLALSGHTITQTQTKLQAANLSAATITRACPAVGCIPSLTCVSSSSSFTGPCANFDCITTINLTIGGILTAACEQITGNLTVGGSTLIEGSLVVESNSDFKGNVCVEGNLNVSGDETVGGNENLAGSLTVNNGAIINGGLTVNGDETITGSVTVSGNQTINQNLLVQGLGTINGLTTANGGLVVFNGETINNGGLNVLNGGASITGDVTVTGSETVDNLEVLGNLTVDETGFLNGCSTTVNGTFTANGPVVMNQGLTIASGDETINTGNLTLNSGNLTVGGFSTFNNPVTANSGATINGGLTVFGGETIATGNLTIANCNNSVTIGGSLSVAGSITSPSEATMGSLTLTNTTNSTSPTTGTLIVNGGVGIGEDLWIGGSEYFANVTTQGGTPSPFNYYEETCFTTRFIAGVASATVTIGIVRIGSIVNLLIPAFTMSNTQACAVISTAGFGGGPTLPARFIPCLARGASSTIIYNSGSVTVGQLGEWEVDSMGNITFGLPASTCMIPPALGPQPFASTVPVQVDATTITYNVLGCSCSN